MHPNLFVSVLLALLTGFGLGALAFLLILLASKITRRPAIQRIVPGLLALAFCLAAFRFTDSIRGYVERLSYQHDLNKLVVLGLLAAALAMGFRLSFLFVGGGTRHRAD